MKFIKYDKTDKLILSISILLMVITLLTTNDSNVSDAWIFGFALFSWGIFFGRILKK
jgi:hypothetical protein